MAEKENTGKAAGLVLGGTATVLAAIALARTQVAKATPGDSQIVNEAITELLIAMASTNVDILNAIQSIFIPSPSDGDGEVTFFQNIRVQGFPDNTQTMIATRVVIEALNTAIELPDIPVPNGFELQIKGWPTNGGLILVSNSRPGATNLNQSWPLLANEAIGYAIQNADELWVSGTAVGDIVVLTVEQRR